MIELKLLKLQLNLMLKKNDIVSPGHVFPLVARSGGVLKELVTLKPLLIFQNYQN